MARLVRVYTFDYIPTEDGDRKVVRDHSPEVYGCEPDRYDLEDGLTSVDLAVRFIRDNYADVEPSSMPYGGPHTWYSNEPYETYEGGGDVWREVTAHPEGFTLGEFRQIYDMLFPQYAGK